ncbi:MAG: c-type cytochrome [Firmicutes bacterium]|nr:c-type cytochrome [Bacillota bacterium]
MAGDRDEADRGENGHPPSRPLLPPAVWAVISGALVLIAAWLVFFWPGTAPERDFAGDVPGIDDDLLNGPEQRVDTAAQLARLRQTVPPDRLAAPNPLAPTPAVLERARTLYGTHCATCHGAQGDANVPVAQSLNPPPVNFTHPAFADMEPGAVFYIISNGSPGTGMAAFGQSLSEEDIWSLVHFLRENFAARGRDDTRAGEGSGGTSDQPRGQNESDQAH